MIRRLRHRHDVMTPAPGLLAGDLLLDGERVNRPERGRILIEKRLRIAGRSRHDDGREPQAILRDPGNELMAEATPEGDRRPAF